jgi:serine/threonine protein kinase
LALEAPGLVSAPAHSAPWSAVARTAPANVLFAQSSSKKKKGSNKTTYYLIGGGVVVLLVLGGLVILVVKGQPSDKPKKSRVHVTETQIDSYKLLNLMMTGQTSQVWECSELSSGRHFALKLLLPEHARDSEQRQYLFHEAEVGKQIVHPNIIKILDLKRDPVHPYVIMEFFPSTNLKLRLMRKDPFIHERIKDVIEKTATGLAYMHSRDWIHRDVKPDNILFSAAGEVRIIDFALASRRATRKKGLFGRMKKVGKAQGTRSYMSPEQIRAEPLDERADVYSFGATLYELLTFRPPFRAATAEDLLKKQLYEKPENPQVYNAEITREMADLIIRMLDKNPDKRPRDFSDFLMKFRAIRVFKPVPVKKKPPA